MRPRRLRAKTRMPDVSLSRRWTIGHVRPRAAAVPLLDVRRDAGEERVLLLRLRRMRQEAGGLEDRDRVVVLVEHLQRRRDAALDAAVAVPLQVRAGRDERAGIVHDGAVHRDLALEDRALQPGSRKIGIAGPERRDDAGVHGPILARSRRVDSRHGRPVRLRAPPRALLRHDGRRRRAPLRRPRGLLRARRALPLPSRSGLLLPDGLPPSPGATAVLDAGRADVHALRPAARPRARDVGGPPRGPRGRREDVRGRPRPIRPASSASAFPTSSARRASSTMRSGSPSRTTASSRDLLARFRREARNPQRGPVTVADPTDLLHAMRLVKAPEEIAFLRARRRDRGRGAPRRAADGPARPVRVRNRGGRGPALPRDGRERAGVPDDRRPRA